MAVNRHVKYVQFAVFVTRKCTE